jgi:hypothetical protein
MASGRVELAKGEMVVTSKRIKEMNRTHDTNEEECGSEKSINGSQGGCFLFVDQMEGGTKELFALLCAPRSHFD